MQSLTRSMALLGGLILVAGAGFAQQQPSCSIQQLTELDNGFASDPVIDGGTVAFFAEGLSSSQGRQLFVWDGSPTQVTFIANAIHGNPGMEDDFLVFSSDAQTRVNQDGTAELLMSEATPPLVPAFYFVTASSGDSTRPHVDGNGNIAFGSDGDLVGRNPDGSSEIFLYEHSTRRLRQITDSPSPSGDSVMGTGTGFENGVIAFSSEADLVGANPDGNFEIFVFDGRGLTQVTESQSATNFGSSLSEDGTRLAFVSDADLTGGNPDGSEEIFSADLTGAPRVTQITDTPGGTRAGGTSISEDGSWIAFSSDGDLTGGNPDRSTEIFVDHGSGIMQLTDSPDRFSIEPSSSRRNIAFTSEADLTGANPDHSREIFLARCTPAPPAGPYLSTPALPGFRFKVRITPPNGNPIIGRQVTPCPAETLCVSGALADRSELYLRIIGPRPNGFLWDNVVRFTPSRVEVWVEETATGEVNYYDLPKIPRRSSELSGLVDKEAFQP